MSESAQVIIGRIRAIARAMGWGIGVHGSLDRDIDLVGVPWIEAACSSDELRDRICAGIDYQEVGAATEKPHGRRGYILAARNAEHDHNLVRSGKKMGPFDPKGRWFPAAIDLSLMDPRTAKRKGRR